MPEAIGRKNKISYECEKYQNCNGALCRLRMYTKNFIHAMNKNVREQMLHQLVYFFFNPRDQTHYLVLKLFLD